MATEKVIPKVIADSGKKWQDKIIYNVELVDGRKGSCFDPNVMKLTIGVETELDVKEGKEYNGVKQYIFNLPKQGSGKGFAPRNPAPDHRAAALTNAVNLVIAGKITLEQLVATRDKFFSYISEGK